MKIEFASIDSELAPADELASACFTTLRHVPEQIRWQLRKSDQWEDLMQETYLTAWKAYQEGMDKREASRLMGRGVYAFLKAYGYLPYRKSFSRMEITFGEALPWEVADNGIPESCETPRPFLGMNSLKDRILEILRQKPEGLTKRNLAQRLGISVDEVSSEIDPLITSGEIIPVEREHKRGPQQTPLLFAKGMTLPPQANTTTAERYKRVLHSYFVEAKSLQQIAREQGGCRKAIGRLVRAAEAAMS